MRMSLDPLVDKFMINGFRVQKINTCDLSYSDLKNDAIRNPERMSQNIKMNFPIKQLT